MPSDENAPAGLPTADEFRRAVEIYLRHAYGGPAPSSVADLVPPPDAEPAEWLAGETIEPSPSDAPLAEVRSFALRLGNGQYPHMKLRLSRPPGEDTYVFSVDCHDAFLTAPAGSPDHRALEELKRHNAGLATAILVDWDAASLPTERNYLRKKIAQARGSAR